MSDKLQFGVSKTVTADSLGMLAIPIHPPIIGQFSNYQNVPYLPADGANIEILQGPNAPEYGNPRVYGAGQCGSEILTEGWLPGTTLWTGDAIMIDWACEFVNA